MDRTTLGRNIRPLERDGLLCAAADPADGRTRLLSITSRGAARFEARYGAAPAAELHAALQRVVTTLHSLEG